MTDTAKAETPMKRFWITFTVGCALVVIVYWLSFHVCFNCVDYLDKAGRP